MAPVVSIVTKNNGIRFFDPKRRNAAPSPPCHSDTGGASTSDAVTPNPSIALGCVWLSTA